MNRMPIGLAISLMMKMMKISKVKKESKRMTELKPCPFCGGKAKRFYSLSSSWIGCTKCVAYGPPFGDITEPQDGMERAITAWNMRKESNNAKIHQP